MLRNLIYVALNKLLLLFLLIINFGAIFVIQEQETMIDKN